MLVRNSHPQYKLQPWAHFHHLSVKVYKDNREPIRSCRMKFNIFFITLPYCIYIHIHMHIHIFSQILLAPPGIVMSGSHARKKLISGFLSLNLNAEVQKDSGFLSSAYTATKQLPLALFQLSLSSSHSIRLQNRENEKQSNSTAFAEKPVTFWLFLNCHLVKGISPSGYVNCLHPKDHYKNCRKWCMNVISLLSLPISFSLSAMYCRL